MHGPVPRIVDATSPSRSLARQSGRRDDPENGRSLLRAPGSTAKTAAPWRQPKVRLGHPIKLILGLETPRGKRPLDRPPAQIARFIHQGARKRMRTHPTGWALRQGSESGLTKDVHTQRNIFLRLCAPSARLAQRATLWRPWRTLERVRTLAGVLPGLDKGRSKPIVNLSSEPWALRPEY